MKLVISILTMSIMTMISCTQDQTNNEADIEALTEISVEQMRVWNEDDYEGFMKIIDEEAIFIWQDGPVLEGYDAVAAAYKDFFNYYDSQVKFILEELHIFGDYAYVRETWSGYLYPKGDADTTFIKHNTNVIIYKKQADNNWKTWRVIYNSNKIPEEN